MAPLLASPSGYLRRSSPRAPRGSGRRRQTLRRSGRGFNRAAVEAALRRALALWGRLSLSNYPHGAIVFCSEGVAHAVHPPRPLQGRVYSCGRHFDTKVLREQVKAERATAYGIIVIDGSDACIGTAQGLGVVSSRSVCTVNSLARLTSGTPGSTRRGGQSALRYSRLREASDLAFLRRVAERASKLLGEARGIVVAGKADTKQRLLPELAPPLRSRVICCLDLPCSAGLDGLRLAASRAAEAANLNHGKEARDSLNDFMELVQSSSHLSEVQCCYGKAHTIAALNLGAVDTLFVAAASTDTTEWQALALAHGTKIVEVQDETENGSRFCKFFKVGGCLRWPLQPDLLDPEDWEGHELDVDVLPSVNDSENDKKVGGQNSEDAQEAPRDCRQQVPDVCELCLNDFASPQSAGNVQSGLWSDDAACEWLRTTLTPAIGDAASAESLVVCAEVLLSDDSVDLEERKQQTAQVLKEQGVPAEVVDEFLKRAM